MKDFIQKNQVFLAAVLSAMILSLQQVLSTRETSWKVIGFVLLISVLGVIANQWKGKGVTVFGMISTLSGVFINIQQSGTFTWNEFIMSSMIAVLTAISGSLNPQKHEDAAPSNYYNPKSQS